MVGETICRLFEEEGPIGMWLEVSPDERWMLLHRHENPTSDLILIEGFR